MLGLKVPGDMVYHGRGAMVAEVGGGWTHRVTIRKQGMLLSHYFSLLIQSETAAHGMGWVGFPTSVNLI